MVIWNAIVVESERSHYTALPTMRCTVNGPEIIKAFVVRADSVKYNLSFCG